MNVFVLKQIDKGDGFTYTEFFDSKLEAIEEMAKNSRNAYHHHGKTFKFVLSELKASTKGELEEEFIIEI